MFITPSNTSRNWLAMLRYKACPLRFAAGVLREGETRYTSGTTPTTYQFTAQRNETALELYYYNARWPRSVPEAQRRGYDPALGRFTSADTMVPGGAQGYDRYAYGLNNPSRYTDPTGHNACSGLSDYRCRVRMRKMEEAWLTEKADTPPPPTSVPPTDVFHISFQMFQVFDPYYYGESVGENYTGFTGSGASKRGNPGDLIGVVNDILLGVRPTFLRKYNPYDQDVSIYYTTTYKDSPRIDAQRIVTVTDLTIQNNTTTMDQVIHYTVSISGAGKNFVATTSAAPGQTANISLPSNLRIYYGSLSVSITAFTGCTGPCITSPNPLVFRGYTSFSFP